MRIADLIPGETYEDATYGGHVVYLGRPETYPEMLDPRRPAFSGPGRQQLVQRKGMDVLVARLGAMVAGEWDRDAWKPVVMSARRLGLPGVYEAAQERRRCAQGFA